MHTKIQTTVELTISTNRRFYNLEYWSAILNMVQILTMANSSVSVPYQYDNNENEYTYTHGGDENRNNSRDSFVCNG